MVDVVDVGFQSEDPRTDFRGAGRLGLLNLHYFVHEYTVYAVQCFEVASARQSAYFMACAGINITFYLLSALQRYEYFEIFSHNISQAEALELFNRIYTVVFRDFNRQFEKHPMREDLMAFQFILVDSWSFRMSILIL